MGEGGTDKSYRRVDALGRLDEVSGGPRYPLAVASAPIRGPVFGGRFR